MRLLQPVEGGAACALAVGPVSEQPGLGVQGKVDCCLAARDQRTSLRMRKYFRPEDYQRVTSELYLQAATWELDQFEPWTLACERY